MSASWSARRAELEARLGRAFEALGRWCAADERLLACRPAPDAWSAGEVLEHVALANRYLLLLADKLARRALRRAAAGARPPDAPRDEALLAELEQLARRERRWPHPAHMAPTGEARVRELTEAFAAQRARCLALLAAAPAGEGALHAVRMSALADGSRKLDLYGWLTLVALHAERHLAQLARCRAAYASEASR